MTNAKTIERRGEVIPDWKFLTNHALVLAWLDLHPQSTARETALAIGITERTTLKIISELDSGGYLTRRRKGRRNVYHVLLGASLRGIVTGDVAVGELLRVIAPRGKRSERDAADDEAEISPNVSRLRRAARRTA